MSSDNVVTSGAERFTGRVKWFNNKAGYGFVTVTDGVKSGSDIFVHHSSIKVDSEQYKYLVQGEYVEFSLIPTNGGTHEWQAADISGIKGGKLMCETRRELKLTRTNYRSDEPASSDAPQKPVYRARGQGPRADTSEAEGSWTQVTKTNVSKDSRPRRVPREKTIV